MRTPFFLAAAVFVIGACGSTKPTEDGATLMHVTLTPDQGGPPAGLTALPTRHEELLVTNPGKQAEIKVVLDTVKDPTTGGQYLHSVEVLVDHSGGGEMSATLRGAPTNMGTAAVPLASRLLEVTWYQDRGCAGKLSGQTSFKLSGDGTILRQ